MIRAISFDLWFTLIWGDDKLSSKYTEYRVSALYDVISKYNPKITIEDIEKLFNYTAHFRMTTHPRKTVKYILFAAGIEADDSIIDEAWRRYEESTYIIRPYLNKKTIDTLENLKNEGYKIGIVSNTSFSVNNLNHILDNIGIIKYFDVIISSADEEVKKPHPEIYHRLINRLRVKPGEVIHVGDKYMDDVIGAYLTGIHGILYRGLWEKYRVYTEFKDEKILDVCPRNCIVIDDLGELLEIVKKY